MTSVLSQNTLDMHLNHQFNTASQGLAHSSYPVVLQRTISNDPISEKTATYVTEISQAATMEVPVKSSSSSNDADYERESVTSYDSDKSKVSEKVQSPLVINIEEEPVEKKVRKVTPQKANRSRDGEIRVEEVKGLGGRDTYLSAGRMIFKILDTTFDEKVKLDQKNKPYFKFRLGLNTATTKTAKVERNKLTWADEINVKYTNQDSALIKVKGRGKLLGKTIAKVRVSIIDVVMKEKRTEWLPLMKGDNVIGKIQVSMEFKPIQ